MRTLRSKGINYRFQKWNLNIIIFEVNFLVKWLKISLEPKNHRLLIPTKMKSGFTELFNHWGFLRVLTKSWVIKKVWKKHTFWFAKCNQVSNWQEYLRTCRESHRGGAFQLPKVPKESCCSGLCPYFTYHRRFSGTREIDFWSIKCR